MRTMIALIALLSLPAPLLAAESEYPRAELLVESAELAQPEVAEKFVILDARPQTEYADAHLPGARWVDHAEWSKAFGEGGDAQAWSDRIGSLGIDADSKVVVYDNNATKDAARIWWILRYWGVDDVRLLNGGWKSWKAEGRPTSQARPPYEPVAFQAKPRSQRLATKDQILDLLTGNRLQIVDARSEGEFCGTDPLKNERAGAIPGAKHLEWSDLIAPETHRFKDAAELKRLFDRAGVDLNRPTASHCQSGGRASVMAFGLELMGARDVRNYYPGWSEWGNDPTTPIAPGKKE
jgi:thiosulfate/3-mercaptopyruvate sulfurtransferase